MYNLTYLANVIPQGLAAKPGFFKMPVECVNPVTGIVDPTKKRQNIDYGAGYMNDAGMFLFFLFFNVFY